MPAKKVANQLSRYDIPRLSRDNFSWVMRFQVWIFISDQFSNYFVKNYLGVLGFFTLRQRSNSGPSKNFNVKTWDPKWIQADHPNTPKTLISTCQQSS